jgi:cobalt-zinc-cadmium efflux system outer membrane protein
MRIATVLMAMLFAITTQQSVQASALTAAFEAACDRTPEIPALVARRAVVDARQNAAGALLPGGPWATVTHRTDALTHDRGTRDYMAEFMVPIWLRGERGASLAAALTEGERLEAEIAFRRLEVAKRVREAYWMAVDAREKAAIAERRRTTSAALLQDVRGQAQTGQVGLMESRMAQADVNDAEAALAGRRAEVRQAVIAFRVLTGLDPPPAFSERNAGRATPASHPRIVLRHRALRKAFAEQDLTWIMDRERPEFGAFAQNMNDTSAEPNVTSLGVRLKIPFAYDAVNQPKRAAAVAEVVAAREELGLAEREVAGDVDQAQVRLDGARQQLAALEARRGNLASVVQLAQEGQRAGQVALSELIRARLQLFEADLARATARAAVQRAGSDTNQALGLEP